MKTATLKYRQRYEHSIVGRVLGKDSFQAYLMLLPMLIGFAFFTIYPMLWLMKWAFYDYDGITTAKFIGLDNFIRAFTRDPKYWEALLNTFIIVFAKLAIEFPLALFLAVLLNKGTRINSMFRTAFFMPTIISTAVIGLIFFLMFEPYQGIVNQVFIKTGLMDTSIEWFGTKALANTIIVIASVWHNFGINMVFFLMGMQTIPNELYECAEIDGVTRWQKFIYITLPMLAPIMKVLLMLAIIGSMKMADLVLVLTNGQPGGQTEVVMTYVFKYFFSYGVSDSMNQFGYASSLSVITGMVLAVITGLYYKLTKND
ncbi:sugar ABC transporter permease [Paenibacillus sp. WQ 127069]|uniref:Sugar ABC transporter permease n=1 Tax=Paenibacillus baimaensis TaxID=2982185 RepID=A0ABT2UER0_9BACL|nr:sugar ABC transporter permease [Paenibacillus sp. WQ 127069]MCU6793133.1 sugar ABC transporter permease [Paenibacillus sp. WQ 127069]